MSANRMMKLPIGDLSNVRVRDVFGDQSPDDLAAMLFGRRSAPPPANHSPSSIEDLAVAALANGGARGVLREFERAVVVEALTKTKGNVSAAARLIGVERKALERRMSRHKIQRGTGRR